MNENRNTYQHTDSRAAQEPSIFDLAVIRLLLAGMYFLLGVTGVRRGVFREQALRLRRVEAEANQVNQSLKNAENHINAWSGDYRCHWRTRLIALSADPNAPDIRFKSHNIVCRFRNARAKTMRPKYHSHTFLALMEIPDLCRDVSEFVSLHITYLGSDIRHDVGVRAPP